MHGRLESLRGTSIPKVNKFGRENDDERETRPITEGGRTGGCSPESTACVSDRKEEAVGEIGSWRGTEEHPSARQEVVPWLVPNVHDKKQIVHRKHGSYALLWI